MRHLTMEELRAGLEHIRQSPREIGDVRLIVRRLPRAGREVVEEGALDPDAGLAGDTWVRLARSHRGDPVDPQTQLTLMNARAIDLIAQSSDRWALAGDQLYVDLDLSERNLPPGSRLSLGTAIIEVSEEPHTGCGRFVSRFGVDAMKFVNSPEGRELRLRGMYAQVVEPGSVRVGDSVRKLSAPRGAAASA